MHPGASQGCVVGEGEAHAGTVVGLQFAALVGRFDHLPAALPQLRIRGHVADAEVQRERLHFGALLERRSRPRSDVGIAYTPGGRIAMAITVDDMPVTDYSPDNPGEELIWEISKVLMAGLAR